MYKTSASFLQNKDKSIYYVERQYRQVLLPKNVHTIPNGSVPSHR